MAISAKTKLTALLIVAALAFNSAAAAVRFDFDGDGKTDPTALTSSSGPRYWYSLKSTGGVSVTHWGSVDVGYGFMDRAALPTMMAMVRPTWPFGANPILTRAVHTAYIYDVANRLTLTDESSQNFTYGYDIADNLISKTLPNGISLRR